MTNKPGLIANYFAGAAIAAHSFTTFGNDDATVILANAGAAILGVSADVDVGVGERVDVVLSDVYPVIYGATVVRGQRLKSDDNGHAIPADDTQPAAGISMVSGVVGDLGSVLLRG